MKRILFILLFIFVAEISFAEVYKWVDEKGVVHFTDDITQIPAKYRGKIEEIGVEEDKSEVRKEGESLPKKKDDSYRDSLGRGEEYWKGRVKESKKQLEVLQERVERLRLKYNELTEKFNSSRSSAERATLRNEREQIKSQMDQCKIQFAEVKEILEKKIPEEADLYKAKPEWIRP